MFTLPSSSIPPPLPPLTNLKLKPESISRGSLHSVGSSATHHPDEPLTPWQLDTSSVLQPKTLLPTPTAPPRYCQPPPTYRGHGSTPRPPAPLFPVPPPGSCLLPPPPLSSTDPSGVVSPHSWHDITPSKADRWRKMSWAAGENGAAIASPPRPAYYNYQKPLQSRPRTLVEVPLQNKVQDHEPSHTPFQANNPISIFQSNLDPNCRPFTPASTTINKTFLGNQPPPPLPPCKISIEEEVASISKEPVLDRAGLSLLSSCGLSTISSDQGETSVSNVDNASFLDPTSEKSLSMSNNSGQESSFTSSHQLEASKLAEDPLPEDPKSFLPQLDISQDEEKSTKMTGTTTSSSSSSAPAQPRFLVSDAALLPPPVFPFATWSGKSRPPLLPTPKNFPPFGPRQPQQVPLFEDEIPCSGASSPKSNFISSSLGNSFLSNSTITGNYIKTDLNLSATIKKPPLVSRFSQQQSSLLSSFQDKSSTIWNPNPQEQESRQFKSSADFSSNEKSWGFGGLPNQLAEWDQEIGGLMSCSLIESYPVPDEYMVARVIGNKLPPVKLTSCHTDLLFFLFYSFQEDYLQLVAASLLFERGWRYHKQDCVWLARWPGVTPEKKTVEWEEGLYQYFDVKVWKRIPGWFRLNYDQLAEKTGVSEQDIPMKQIYGKPWLNNVV